MEENRAIVPKMFIVSLSLFDFTDMQCAGPFFLLQRIVRKLNYRLITNECNIVLSDFSIGSKS